MSKQFMLSREAYENLQKDLEFLKTVKRVEIGQAIKKAREFGDLSENSEYDEAKNEQAEVEAKIAHYEEVLKNAVIIDESQIDTTKVSIGCKVQLFDLDTEEEMNYQIVGSTEADPIEGKISDESPFGKALLGHKKGDTATIETPGGIVRVSIVSISK